MVEKSLLLFCTALEQSQTAENLSSSAAAAASKPFVQEILLEQEAELCKDCKAKRNNFVAQQEIENLVRVRHKNAASYDAIVAHCGCILPHSLLLSEPRTPLDVMYDILGFTIERGASQIAGGGTGVVVTKGTIPKGCVLAMYPGK